MKLQHFVKAAVPGDDQMHTILLASLSLRWDRVDRLQHSMPMEYSACTCPVQCSRKRC